MAVPLESVGTARASSTHSLISHRCFLLTLPDAVFAQMADDWLADQDAICLAASGRWMLRSLQRYRIKHRVSTLAARLRRDAPYSSFRIGQAIRAYVPSAATPAIGASKKGGRGGSGSNSSSVAAASVNSASIVAFVQQQLDLLPSSVLDVELRLNNCKATESLSGLRVPEFVRAMFVGDSVESSLKGVILPAGLDSFKLGYAWNQPISELPVFPDGLQFLVFGSQFNQPINGLILPSRLTGLELGWCFNQAVERTLRLPESLRTLEFSFDFNQPIEQLNLPSTLTRLTFGRDFNQSLRNVIFPASLMDFRMSYMWNLPCSQLQIPASLRSFTCPLEFKGEALPELQLPPNLTELALFFDKPLQQLRMPSSLTSISLGTPFNQSLKEVTWPASLSMLKLSVAFKQPIGPRDLPPTLRVIDMRKVYDYKILLSSIHLPITADSQLHCRLPNRFNEPLSSLPQSFWTSSLTGLHLGSNFNKPLSNWIFPPSLTELQLSEKWNQSVTKLNLPPNLRVLIFGKEFNQPVDSLQLPFAYIACAPILKFKIQSTSSGSEVATWFRGVAAWNLVIQSTTGWITASQFVTNPRGNGT